MTGGSPLDRFRLSAVEAIDVVASQDDVRALRRALEAEVVERRGRGGLAGVEALIEELNALGNVFVRMPRDDGWAMWLQHTNGGTRHFYIHAELDDPGSVMVLYDETIDAMVARRRSEMDPDARARDERVASFYDRGLALVTGGADYADLDEADRILVCLYRLQTGVANGGFRTYVVNTGGAYLDDARAYLRRLGADELAAIVGEVIDALPPLGGGLTEAESEALDERQEHLSALDDRFYEAESGLAERVLDFLDDAT